MAADLVHLHSDAHREVQELLPWYCTGQIGGGERARVEAHIGECAACQAELRLERRLGEEVAALPMELELGWLDLRRHLELRPSLWARLKATLIELWHGLGSGEYVRWAVAAQLCLLVLLVSVIAAPDRTAEYHTLGTPTAHRDGNLLVMFKPETQERALRQSLEAAGAQLVDGPTPAGAYVLFVDPNVRPAALAALRADAGVLMAEPLDESAR